MSIVFLSVDLQNDFTTKGGAHYGARPCVPFIQNTLLPFIHEQGYTVAEIISDYRVTTPEQGSSVCVPGMWGYESIIPVNIKHASVWVKSEPSPAWIRKGAGNADCSPGVPYPSPDDFTRWLSETIGPPSLEREIILIGLVLEVCVLSTIYELHHRGYRVKVLFEGVDTHSGDQEQKKFLFETLFPFWASPVYWDDLNKMSI